MHEFSLQCRNFYLRPIAYIKPDFSKASPALCEDTESYSGGARHGNVSFLLHTLWVSLQKENILQQIYINIQAYAVNQIRIYKFTLKYVAK